MDSRILTILITSVCLSSYSDPIRPSECVVHGNIKGLGNRTIYFNYDVNKINHLDSVTAHNDRFLYGCKKSDSNIINVRVFKQKPTAFWYEKGNIQMTGNLLDGHFNVTNTPENDLLNKYNRLIDWQKDKGKSEKEFETLEFIRSHLKYNTSAYLLYWETVINQNVRIRYKNIYDSLSEEVKSSYYGLEVKNRIHIIENQPEVGKKILHISLRDNFGNFVSTTNFSGKYILLDFWGHWCSPCIKSFPKLKDIQKRYKSLIIIGIAAESIEDKQKWIDTIKKHDASWIQLSEFTQDKGEVNSEYNITAFPTYILINREGTVIARSLYIEPIQDTLKVMRVE